MQHFSLTVSRFAGASSAATDEILALFERVDCTGVIKFSFIDAVPPVARLPRYTGTGHLGLKRILQARSGDFVARSG